MLVTPSSELSFVSFYRPQTKFARVMFSQVFVRGGGGDLCPGGWDLCPGSGLYPRGLCLGGVSFRETPVQLHAGGTHPTGMHFCVRCKRRKWSLVHIDTESGLQERNVSVSRYLSVNDPAAGLYDKQLNVGSEKQQL